MATYKGIKGVKVVTKATDPTASEATGTVWYNSTSPSALKYSIEGAGAWSAGGTLNNGIRGAGGTGTITAALKAGGMPPTGPVAESAVCETYDGTSWTAVGALVLGRPFPVTFGTTTAAITATGYNNGTNATYANSETWNGSAWTETADVNSPRAYASCANQGTTTAGLIFAGAGPGVSPPLGVTESYNGTSYTEENDMNTARKIAGGGGTSTAAFIAGGSPPIGVLHEQWNGTSWSEKNNLNTARYTMGSSGTTTSALIFAGTGDPPLYALTEQWNGTSWTEVGDLGTARERPARGTGASGTSALCIGGSVPPAYTLTEEWADPVYTIKTVTVS